MPSWASSRFENRSCQFRGGWLGVRRPGRRKALWLLYCRRAMKPCVRNSAYRMAQRNCRMKQAYRSLLLMAWFHRTVMGTNKDINFAWPTLAWQSAQASENFKGEEAGMQRRTSAWVRRRRCRGLWRKTSPGSVRWRWRFGRGASRCNRVPRDFPMLPRNSAHLRDSSKFKLSTRVAPRGAGIAIRKESSLHGIR